MKTIVLGFKTADGKGPATLLAGPDVPVSKQAAHVAQIKSSRDYPEGIIRVEFCELVPRNIGISLSSQEPVEQPKPEKKKSK